MTRRSRSKITLGARDAAVVLRADGSIELAVPQQAEDDAVPRQAMVALGIAVAAKDPAFGDRVQEAIAALVGSLAAEGQA